MCSHEARMHLEMATHLSALSRKDVRLEKLWRLKPVLQRHRQCAARLDSLQGSSEKTQCDAMKKPKLK